MPSIQRSLAGFAAASVVLSLAACADKADSSSEGGAGGPVAISASTTECKPDTTQLDSGVTTFSVKNTGDQVTEIYVLRPNGSTVGERENIGPGSTINLTVELPAGDYTVRCRASDDAGDGVRSAIKVTGSAQATQSDARIKSAVDGYRAYVTTQAADSLEKTRTLQAAIDQGDVKAAKAAYAPSRYGWESVEPVAEAFGDLDPAMDLREADLEDGQKWTGWHVIEKQLWEKNSTDGMKPVAAELIKNLETLNSRVPTAQITGTSMANGAKELLDEVATGKITGEEEAFSHTDLVDFQANVEGAKKAYDLLKPVVAQAQPDLATQLDTEFANIQKELDAVKTGDANTDFPSYETVDKAERDKLSAAVDALAEPLSHLAAAVAPSTGA